MTKEAIFNKWIPIVETLTKNVNDNIREDVRQDIYLSLWEAVTKTDNIKQLQTDVYTTIPCLIKKTLAKYKNIKHNEISLSDNEIRHIFDSLAKDSTDVTTHTHTEID